MDERTHPKDLISTKKRRLHLLRRQQAVYGIECPLHIVMEIEDLHQEIAQLENKIEDSDSTFDLIQIKMRRLEHLKVRQATFGFNTPKEILIEIEDLQQQITELNKSVPLAQLPIHKSSLDDQTVVAPRMKVFVSYSRTDIRWLRRLQVHLKPLERLEKIMLWSDEQIEAGQRWREEINTAMNESQVAILLISADFLASDFIADNELPPLLAAAESQGAIILPIIVSACRFEHTETLSPFQSVNPPDRPLNTMSKGRQEAVFVKVSEDVEKALEP